MILIVIDNPPIKIYIIVNSNRVRTGPGKPVKYCGFVLYFSGLESPGKRLLVMESSKNLLSSIY